MTSPSTSWAPPSTGSATRSPTCTCSVNASSCRRDFAERAGGSGRRRVAALEEVLRGVGARGADDPQRLACRVLGVTGCRRGQLVAVRPVVGQVVRDVAEDRPVEVRVLADEGGPVREVDAPVAEPGRAAARGGQVGLGRGSTSGANSAISS